MRTILFKLWSALLRDLKALAGKLHAMKPAFLTSPIIPATLCGFMVMNTQQLRVINFSVTDTARTGRAIIYRRHNPIAPRGFGAPILPHKIGPCQAFFINLFFVGVLFWGTLMYNKHMNKFKVFMRHAISLVLCACAIAYPFAFYFYNLKP